VKDHIEDEINHFHRGKSHTSPDKEKDVKQLQEAYHNANIHVLTEGREINEKDGFVDIESLGSEAGRLCKAMESWLSNRISEWSDMEDWTETNSVHVE
jgi:hypothetical protein